MAETRLRGLLAREVPLGDRGGAGQPLRSCHERSTHRGSGETLGGKAEKYDLSLADLVRWNGIENPDLVTVGQKIELSGDEAPVREPPAGQVYVVQPGDTVSQIAERFGLRCIDASVANKVDDADVIRAGQHLIIPSQGVAR